MLLNSVRIIKDINMKSTEPELLNSLQSSNQSESQTSTFVKFIFVKFASAIPLLNINQKKRKACKQLQNNITKNLLEKAKENLLKAYKYTNQEEILQALKHVSHTINNTTSRELNQLINSNQQIEKTTQAINQMIKNLHQKAQKVEQIN